MLALPPAGAGSQGSLANRNNPMRLSSGGGHRGPSGARACIVALTVALLGINGSFGNPSIRSAVASTEDLTVTSPPGVVPGWNRSGRIGRPMCLPRGADFPIRRVPWQGCESSRGIPCNRAHQQPELNRGARGGIVAARIQGDPLTAHDACNAFVRVQLSLKLLYAHACRATAPCTTCARQRQRQRQIS